MKILYNADQFVASQKRISLTIGNFDGVHLGHQALLQRLKEVAPFTVVFSFSNQPCEVLHGIKKPWLTTLPHRLSLFEKLGIDETILFPFSKTFAEQSAFDFLKNLKKHIPFTHLVLGHDAVLGHDRNQDLSDVAQELGFSLEYLDVVTISGKIISSSEIRKRIQEGDLTAASLKLGRPYSIFASVGHGSGKGGKLGFHTANLPVENLALPPLGVYAVHVKIGDEILAAVANLGHAPTLHENRKTCLEVHLIDENRNLYGSELEVLFLNFLRPEKKFESFSALQAQIQKDVQFAKEACYASHR